MPSITRQFDLVRTTEMRIDVPEGLEIRVELFRDSETPGAYYARIWELEHFNLVPTFPQGPDGTPLHQSCDPLLAERSHMFGMATEVFTASDDEEAVSRIMSQIRSELSRWSGTPSDTDERSDLPD